MASKVEDIKGLLALLDNDNVFYCIDDDYQNADIYGKEVIYNMVSETIITQKLVRGDIGTIGDNHILYLLSSLGVASVSSLARVYARFGNLNKELSMSHSSIELIKEHIGSRLENFCKIGYVIRINLTNKKQALPNRTVYVLSGRAAGLCGDVLQRRVWIDTTLFAKPIMELQGYILASEVASRVIDETGAFVANTEREHKYPTVGEFRTPIEYHFLVGKDDKHFVAFYYGFFDFNKRIHTKSSYSEYCTQILNQIIYFLNYRTRRNTKGTASVIVVVKDRGELDYFVKALSLSDKMDDVFNNLYFTSESILNSGLSIGQCLISVTKGSDGRVGYSYKKAPFIVDK